MATQALEECAPLPAPIGDVLRLVAARDRWTALARGVGRLALVATTLLALMMAMDLAWPLPGIVRWILWAISLGVLGLMGIRWVARPLLEPKDPRTIAGMIERVDQGWAERLVATVDLLTTPSRARHGSPELVDAITADVAATLGDRRIDAARVVPGRTAVVWWLLGLASIVGLIGSGWTWPDPVGAFLQRAALPWTQTPRPSRIVFSIEPGNVVRARGDGLAIEAQLTTRWGNEVDSNTAVTLTWRDESGRQQQRSMTAKVGDSDHGLSFHGDLAELNNSSRYRVATGDAESDWYHVEVRDRPRLKELVARVDSPSYTRQPARDVAQPRVLDVWQDSLVTWVLEADRPLRAASVDWPREKRDGQTADTQVSNLAARGNDGRSWTITLPATASGAFRFRMVDTGGLESVPEAPRRLTARVDSAPVVRVGGNESARPTAPGERLRLGVAGVDDLGIASAELHISIDRQSDGSKAAQAEPDLFQQPITLDGLGKTEVRGVAELDLAPLGLQPGDGVSLRVKMTDNRPAPRGPNVGWSTIRKLAIVGPEEKSKAGASELEAVQQQLDAIHRLAGEERKAVEELRYQADAAHRGAGRWSDAQRRALADRMKRVEELIDRLQLLARDLDARPHASRTADATRRLAELEVAAAQDRLRRASGATDPAQRLNDLKRADEQLAAAQGRLAEIQRQVDALGNEAEDRRRLAELADREEALARQAEALAKGDGPVDRAGLDRAEAEQDAIRKTLDDILRSSPGMRAELLKRQAMAAESLAREVRELAERQAGDTQRLGRLAEEKLETMQALAEAQRALEIDARRLTLRLDPELDSAGLPRANIDMVRQPADPLARGAIEEAHRLQADSVRELKRLSGTLSRARTEAKPLIRHLVGRLNQLRGPIAEALRLGGDPSKLSDADRRERAERLGTLLDQERRVFASLDGLQVPNEKRGLMNESRDALRVAIEGLESQIKVPADAGDAERRFDSARDAMQRLADALPDPNQRLEPLQRAFAQARERFGNLANELERHLRETESRNDRQPDPAELGRRVAPLAETARSAAEVMQRARVEASDPAARQLSRVVSRLNALAKDLSQSRPDRMALEAALVEGRAVLDRLGRVVEGQEPDDARAAGLSDRLTALGPDAKADDEGDSLQQIASAVRWLDVPEARIPRDEALRALEATLADGEKEGARQRAELSLKALRDRLNGDEATSEELTALANALRSASKTMGRPETDRELARRVTADLLQRVSDAPAKVRALEAVQRVVELADRRRRAIDDPAAAAPGPEVRAQTMVEAADEVTRLASQVLKAPPQSTKDEPRPGTDDAGITKADEAEARVLVERQRSLRERSEALLAAPQKAQTAVVDDTDRLALDAVRLKAEVAGVSPRAEGPAREAVDLLSQQVPRSATEVIEHLDRVRLAPAGDASRRVGEQLARAADRATDLARELRADAAEASREPEQPSPAQDENNALAQAREAMRSGQQKLDEARSKRAEAGKEAVRKAAESIREAAQGLASSAQDGPGDLDLPATPDVPSRPDAQSVGDRGDGRGRAQASSDVDDPSAGPAGQAAPDLAQLRARLRSRTKGSWGELPGHLRDEILQQGAESYRPEYARLIRLYFRDIAAGATPSGGAGQGASEERRP